jgi:hypothetical protein
MKCSECGQPLTYLRAVNGWYCPPPCRMAFVFALIGGRSRILRMVEAREGHGEA